jgi:hypothetical protein
MKRALLTILATTTLFNVSIVEAKSILNDLNNYKQTFDNARAKSAADPNYDYHDSRVSLWEVRGKSQKADLTEGQAAHSPWSGSSWSFNRGSTALRYKDPVWRKITESGSLHQGHIKLFNKFKLGIDGFNGTWKDYRDDKFFGSLPRTVGKDSYLSPVEKYDALLDDDYFGLTQFTWVKLFEDFEVYENKNNNVPTYYGFCDGWALASSIHPKPIRPVTLYSPFAKRSVTFDVPDIRALVSMFYQTYDRLEYTMLGTRCSKGYNCSIVNPGLFHMAVLNRIGHEKKPLLYDSAEDYEVWNKVMKSFDVQYFNPHNKVTTSRKGKDINKYKNAYAREGFKRDINMTHTVGVELNIEVVRLRTKYDMQDIVSTYTYYYELELDRNNNIVGGEWLQDVGANPDFVWYAEKPDFDVDEADGDQFPKTLLRRATYDAHNRGLLHPWVIKQLIEKSTQPAAPAQP